MHRAPRLVLIVPTFPKLSETFIVSKFLGLLARGWDVHVVCSHSSQDEWQRFPDLCGVPGIRGRVHVQWPSRPRWLAALLTPTALGWCLIRNPIGTVRYLAHGWRQFSGKVLARFYLDASMLALRPGAIHFEFGALAVERVYLKELLDTRLGVSFRGYDLNYVGIDVPDYYHDVWATADGLHFLGEYLRRQAVRRGCPPGVRHTLIPPAIDSALSNEPRTYCEVLGTTDRPIRILSVGRLEWEKGYEYALEAMAILISQGLICSYRIVGDGRQLEALAFARHQLDLEGVVDLLGACSHEDVKRQLLWADIVVHAATAEGFCNAVLEAQATGIPVVCSDAGGLPENVVDGVTGLVVPRRDPEALANAISRLAADRELRQQMGNAGRERVVRQFALADQISAFERFYLETMDSTGASHGATVSHSKR